MACQCIIDGQKKCFIYCRPTHLIESHVSGLLVKKEVTDEGEVMQKIPIIIFFCKNLKIY